MKLLRLTLPALLASATLFACSTEPATSDVQNQTESDGMLMAPAPPEVGGIEIYRDQNDAWRFVIVDQSGGAVLESEAYAAKESAYNGVVSVKENGVLLEQYVLIDNPNGTIGLALQATNFEVIAHGAQFDDMAAAENAMVEARELVAAIVQVDAARHENAPAFELFRADNQEWAFTLTTASDEVLLESETYQRRTGALNGIDSVRENGKLAERFGIEDRDEGLFLVLDARNGQEIASAGPLDGTAEAEALQAQIIELLRSERVANPW